jgi:hypothetical protein
VQPFPYPDGWLRHPQNQKFSFNAICMTRDGYVALITPAVAAPMLAFGF